MLKGIPTILSPKLLKIMMEMGHGDEIVISDGNFPGANLAKKLVRCDGNNVCEVLDAFLKFFPLDQYSKAPAALMAVVPGDSIVPIIWKSYEETIIKHEPNFKEFDMVERFDFYERAKNAYAIVATGEKAQYANIILKKGVVIEVEK
ncbi:L-fucose mutarotase [Clostridium lacusfryxellense]|uniref:L-fucose mutarotase n=1 Tax=Clostridium lacusfryxellense TaxID=205328 RepID=UPI001C0BEEE1|nr:L-fucose mutarotase [Clostridium lacusfryxellense]MBU3112745.1 L-fucose mutarotase [Clostridium lacusfryxellense]